MNIDLDSQYENVKTVIRIQNYIALMYLQAFNKIKNETNVISPGCSS